MATNPPASNASVQEVAAELKTTFDGILANELEGKVFDNQECKAWREAIAQTCVDELKAAIAKTGSQYMFSLTVMVFEKAGFNRAVSTMMRKSDVLVSAEYRGGAESKVYGLVDAVLVKL
jgi:hypothetical protein